MVAANNIKMTFSVFPENIVDVLDEKLSVEVFRIVRGLFGNTF
jgi:hypothetical protein